MDSQMRKRRIRQHKKISQGKPKERTEVQQRKPQERMVVPQEKPQERMRIQRDRRKKSQRRKSGRTPRVPQQKNSWTTWRWSRCRMPSMSFWEKRVLVWRMLCTSILSGEKLFSKEYFMTLIKNFLYKNLAAERDTMIHVVLLVLVAALFPIFPMYLTTARWGDRFLYCIHASSGSFGAFLRHTQHRDK